MIAAIAGFFRWLGTPFRAVRSWFPFSHEGRQTLIYLMFSLSTGVLTLALWWAMDRFFADKQWRAAQSIADKMGWALLISVSAYACFVSLRAISLGMEGLNVQARYLGKGAAPIAKTTTTTETTIRPPPDPPDDNKG